jgi:CelD/BcsL family acetyltransferase involved in cellulose biosynthesis
VRAIASFLSSIDEMHDGDDTLHGQAVATPSRCGPDGFASVRWAWQQLDADARYYFQSLAWMDSVAALVDDDVVWDVVAESDQPVAVSLMGRSRPSRAGIRLRVLTGVPAGDMGYPFTDCVLGSKAAATGQIEVEDLMRACGAWDVMNIRSRRIGSPWVALAAGRGWVHEEPDGGVGILDTRCGAEEWRRSLPKNMRDSVRKARGRIASSGGSEVVVSTGSELPAAFAQWVALEASGWKGVGGKALAHRPEWREVLGRYLRLTESAQIRSLVVDGRVVASQICVTCDRSLVLMKVAYDEELARLSPGNVLMADLVETCCENPDIDRIDCTVWLDWHQRWGMTREPTFRILAFNRRTLRGRAAEVAWKLRRRLKPDAGTADPPEGAAVQGL